MNYIDEIADQIAGELHDLPISDEWRPLYRLYALLCLAKGDETSLADVHDAWTVFTLEHQPDHKSLIPFDDLTPEVQARDQPYKDAIQIVAEIRKGNEGEIVRVSI